MAYTFTRKTDNVDKIMAVDINELQAAIEDVSTNVDTMSNINATFFLSAAGITPNVPSGCADPEMKSTTNNFVTYKIAAYDPNTVEYGRWNHPLPSDYNGGTVTYRVFWEHPATTTNFKVVWDLKAKAVGDNAAIDGTAAGGSPVYDEGGTTNNLYITPWSSPLTIGGTPAAGKMVFWVLSRYATDGTNDTLAVDAWVHYVEIRYTRA